MSTCGWKTRLSEFVIPQGGCQFAAEPVLAGKLGMHGVDAGGEHGGRPERVGPRCPPVRSVSGIVTMKGLASGALAKITKAARQMPISASWRGRFLALVVEIAERCDDQQIEMADARVFRGVGTSMTRPMAMAIMIRAALGCQKAKVEVASSDQEKGDEAAGDDGDIQRHHPPPAHQGKDHRPGHAGRRQMPKAPH